MPPSLRLIVGVPPATVTASLIFSVSVTTSPTLRLPLEGDSDSDVTVGVVVSICSGPASVVTAPVRFAA